ncbi:ABC transporter ATP-binding protein [Paenibacillus sp. 481]|uniref:ABC transporter ATP-binding protein n=1 Tax=Paenibacillus sp. 481 TaxID=2835869 RepID=UPI001E5B7448|nr:ABC transporter ATP-binding protein [Paenibacillus sp. 481]UHA73160.1 ABC transporter ATP-binding protein [Paenibacillus sp. 481]
MNSVEQTDQTKQIDETDPQQSKPINTKQTLIRLLTYFKPFKAQLLVIVFAAIVSALFTIVGPKILGDATTILFNGVKAKMDGVAGAAIDFEAIFRILLVLAGIYTLSALFSYLEQYLVAGVAQKVVYQLRKQASEKLSRLPVKYFDSRPNGDLLSRIVNDVDNISNSLSHSLTQLLTALITLIGVVSMMLYISPLLTLIVFLTLPLSFYAAAKVATRAQDHFTKRQESLGELNSHVEEMYNGHNIVKGFGQEQHTISKFEKCNEKLYHSVWKSEFVSGIIEPLMSIINKLAYVFICVVGGIFVLKRAIEIGDVQAFIQYTQQFAQPILQLAHISSTIQSTIASAARVFELLDEEEEVQEEVTAQPIHQPKGEVRFQHVQFGYTEDKLLMTDMSIDVKEGQKVAIVGPTGSGKTTLINLLMRFYEVNGGQITIDGRDISKMNRVDLRRMFGMVLQDTWLFNGTIRENIAYGRTDATDADIFQAAKQAYADPFIRKLPDGYDTILNENVTNLSQGQKQLLTIARAILTDPSILVLDEATSNIDTRTEIHIQRAMKELMKGRTSFIIAHRLSTIRDADLIVVMNSGNVVEQGSHEQLLAKGGMYADLYNSQFAEASKMSS